MILASQSLQRKKLMNMLFEDYKIISYETEEKFDNELNIYDNLKNIAYEKAIAVYDKNNIKNDYILGVDTIVYFENNILLKPTSYNDAFNMINSYKGKEQEVISGIALIEVKNGKIIETKKDYVISKVEFNNLSDNNIKKWLDLDLYKYCSGGFMIEKIEDEFELKINGSYSNIIGLPLEKLKEMALAFGLSVFQSDIKDIDLIKKYM